MECVYRLHIHAVWAPDTLFYVLYCLENRTRYMRYMTPIYIIVVTCAGEYMQEEWHLCFLHPENPIRTFASVKNKDSFFNFSWAELENKVEIILWNLYGTVYRKPLTLYP